MIFSTVSVSAFAIGNAGIRSDTPIVYIHGKNSSIVDKDGKTVYDFDYDTSNVWDDVVEVCKDSLLKGIITGDFSDYYNALYKKISEIYGDAQCDNNGEPKNGTHCGNIGSNEKSKKNIVDKSGQYQLEGYNFWYDWRLDPYEVVDELDAYINNVLKATGKSQVSLIGRCLGGAFITSYVEKYGTSKIKSLVYDEVTLMGGEMISDIFSGKVNTNPESLTRFVEGDMSGELNEMLGSEVFEFLASTLDLLNFLNATGVITDIAVNKIFNKIGRGIMSVFVRASFGTWPAYWTTVNPDDFETAKTFVFGDEGSETRQEFAGLIEKIDNYYNKVKVQFGNILTNAKDNGVNVGIVCKYGVQAFPYVNDPNQLSDSFVSIQNASFGATASKIGETLSDSYIATADSKYISVDKMVDASTCLFPDNTWFIKGSNHDDSPAYEDEILRRVASSDKQYTVFDDEDAPQFASYIASTNTCEPMTEENMNCESYKDVVLPPAESTKKETIFNRVAALIKFLIKAIKLAFSKLTASNPTE